MKEYKVEVVREYRQSVKDIYTIYAENEDEAREKSIDLINSPELMVETPHDSIDEPESRVYSDEKYAHFYEKGSDNVFILE